MTKNGQAKKITNDTGRNWTENEAQEQIDLFYSAYPEFKDWQDQFKEDYVQNGGVRIPCGWRMFGDNDNLRSVCNVPIQGYGASVMREAVDRAVKNNCTVIFTLHDAIYIEDEIGNEFKIETLAKCMQEAFRRYSPKKHRHTAVKIKLDPFAWSPSYEKDSGFTLRHGLYVPCSNLYIDERAAADYERFSKYFSKPDSDEL